MDSLLKIVADNPALTDVLRNHLESHFLQDDARTDAISDEQLGQMYRARLVGLQKIDAAFKEIASYKSHPERPVKFNGAR